MGGPMQMVEQVMQQCNIWLLAIAAIPLQQLAVLEVHATHVQLLQTVLMVMLVVGDQVGQHT